MSDNSTLKGRKHTTAMIRSLIHSDRWPYWYRKYKPDHIRSNTDDVRNEAINVFDHDDVADQSDESKKETHNFYERVSDNEDAYELIGQVKAKIHSVRQAYKDLGDGKIIVTVGRIVAAHDYHIQLGDHFIELGEDVESANRREWKLITVALIAEQFYSGEVICLVGVHG